MVRRHPALPSSNSTTATMPQSPFTPTTTKPRQKSNRLITTTPSTTLSTSLHSIKSQIPPHLFDGIPILKISSKGTLVPRILTLSDDLFTIFISHDTVKTNEESFSDRVKYKSYKMYSKFVTSVVGHPSTHQTHRDIRVIDVADVTFVQSGFVGSQKLESCRSAFDVGKVVSIFHGDDRNVDFVVEDDGVREGLLEAIEVIRRRYEESKVMIGRERMLLRYIWYDTDWNKSGMISQTEFLYLLVRINVYIKKELAIKLFNDVAKTNSDVKKLSSPRSKPPEISFNQCIDLLQKIKSELFHGNKVRDEIFDSVFGAGKEEVTKEEFLEFLHSTQKDTDATLDDVSRIFSELNNMEILRADHEESEHNTTHETIDRLLFEEYLMSSQNDVYDPKRREFDASSLGESISHYWINTSHNTYLTGDQLKSFSSVEMYVLALQKGCKCIELDCWDDTTAQIPVVYHGYTLTSQIPFQDIITAVKFYIKSNPTGLPIILSLENHCTPAFQRQMAVILKTTLEDMLYVPPCNCSELPSPIDLIGKVLIKGKRPPEKEDIEEMNTSSKALGGEEKVPQDQSSTEHSDKKTVEDLAKLTLLNGVSFKDFAISQESPATDMHSFSETKITKILKNPENAKLWREYNKDHMSRTYPAGSRVDSSNDKPLVAWAMGCQLVALNFQTHDAAMVINHGKFRENGGCGYIRKPDSLLFAEDDSQLLGKDITLKIRVLSGTCLPKPKAEKVGEVIDPYVVIRVYDISALDGSNNASVSGSSRKDLLDRSECKTDEIRDNGYCPQWNSGEFSFAVTAPDVAMVSFYVIDSDGGFLDENMCKAAIPVSCLRQGYRSIQFYDQCNTQHGPFEFASILVEVDIKPGVYVDKTPI